MYSFLAAEAPASFDLWAVFDALRLLQDAEDQLVAAECVGTELVAESSWHNEGLAARSLREALDEMHQQIRGETIAVREQQGVVRAVVR
ncbi:hypothetical protein LC082_08020 [Microbacterium esteraromaticum]|uniref:hypothetical protein n=1 Tax=Microbacterium esteraromaticum TaxID=57043 RepID=UPI001CD64C8A|nr:hypothetical protein [Microbacterium esteraromaticum]MCA1306842.1 hypothetical protein [Microbacterium esteraromaticum]